MYRELQQFPLFAGLSPTAIEALVKDLKPKAFRTGETLMRQGEPATKGYLLLEGKVEVLAESTGTGDARQKRTIIYHAAPHVVGFIELLQKRPLLGTVVALERVQGLEVDRAAYMGILQRNHQLCVNAIKMLSDLLWQTAEDRRVRLFGAVDHLVANSICYLARLYGEARSNGVLVTKELNKSALAESLGVARRSVIRAIENLESEGLVEVSGRQVWIPDLKRLQQRARDSFDAGQPMGLV